MAAAAKLSAEQEAFLEECMLEFANRFTDSDKEYKQIYDSKIPPPPIMCPWYGRPKMANRFRGAGGSRNYDREQFHRQDNFRDYYPDNNAYRHRDRRYRPY